METIGTENEKPPNDRTRVIADDREAESPVVMELAARGDVQLEIRRLALGDYEVGCACLFERKTVRDFALSLVDGRLFHQAHRLRGTGWPCALIIEGNMADLAQVHVRREALQGAIITLSLVFQIAVFRAITAAETARLLVYAGSQLQRESCGHVVKPKRRCSQRRRAQLFVLQSLPGIGPKRAVALLDRFGSVKAVMNASSDELAAVSGMGPGVIQKVQWAIGAGDIRPQ
jgi:DNA excision repair protein ERCC-4